VTEARADGDEIVLAIGLNNLGNLALNEGDLVSARAYIEESAALNRRLGQQDSTTNDLIDLGFIALAENRLDAAANALRESLALGRAERSSPDKLIWAVEGLAALSLDRGDAVAAVRLLAATTRPRAELGIPSDLSPIGEELREQTLQGAREKLGEAAFAAAWEEGDQLSLDEAVESASRI
jgi:MalT-like TPR region